MDQQLPVDSMRLTYIPLQTYNKRERRKHTKKSSCVIPTKQFQFVAILYSFEGALLDTLG